MAKTQNYRDVAPAVWACVRATTQKRHGTRYEPAGEDCGRATTHLFLGDVILDYAFDPKSRTLAYSLVKKPFLVAESQIWSGIQSTIERCRR